MLIYSLRVPISHRLSVQQNAQITCLQLQKQKKILSQLLTCTLDVLKAFKQTITKSCCQPPY
jgi:hypothetical protein